MAPGTGRYVCPKCAARFPTVGDKRRHMKTCREEYDDHAE